MLYGVNLRLQQLLYDLQNFHALRSRGLLYPDPLEHFAQDLSVLALSVFVRQDGNVLTPSKVHNLNFKFKFLVSTG